MSDNFRWFALFLGILALPAWAADEEVVLSADRVSSEDPNHWQASGNVEVQYQNRTLYADQVVFDRNSNELVAKGHVRLLSPGLSTEAPEARVRVDKNQGIVLQPRYQLPERQAHGQAEKAEQVSKDHYTLTQADYTTCNGSPPAWRIKARTFRLNEQDKVATVRDGHLDVLNVPVMYLPYFSYSTSPARRSGLLAPSIGNSDVNGATLALPYYWNIRPNMDAVITPRILGKRGLQLQNEFRYLGDTSSANVHFDILPADRLTGTTVYATSVQQHKWFSPHLSSDVNLNYVSYPNYLVDLGGNLGMANVPYLSSAAALNYSSETLRAGLAVKGYQDLAQVAEAPYQQLPYAFLNGRWALGRGLYSQLDGDFNYFTRQTGVVGQRMNVVPRLGWRWEGPGGYLEPQVGAYLTQYQLQRSAPEQKRNPRRILPLASLSGGLFFDRDWGRGVVQTLEPQFRYVYLPAGDQSALPLFDTGMRQLTYPILFEDNFYAGEDRVNRANRVTLGLSSTWHATATGRELLRASLGQIRYFNTRQVDISGNLIDAPRHSDYFAAAHWQPWADTGLFADAQYNSDAKRMERYNLGVQYLPKPGHVLNLSYRYTRDLLDQAAVSVQWPVSRKWSGLGSYRYSLSDKRMLERLVGVDYDGGCWALRLMTYQQLRLGGQTNNVFYFQVLLRGLTTLGNQPTDIMRQLVPGVKTEF